MSISSRQYAEMIARKYRKDVSKLDEPPAIQDKADAKAEKELQRQITTYLREHRGLVVGVQRMDKPTTMPVGWPDMVFVFCGVPVALEVKTSFGRLSPEQIEMAQRMVHDGWRWQLVSSLEEVRKMLDEIEEGR